MLAGLDKTGKREERNKNKKVHPECSLQRNKIRKHIFFSSFIFRQRTERNRKKKVYLLLLIYQFKELECHKRKQQQRQKKARQATFKAGVYGTRSSLRKERKCSVCIKLCYFCCLLHSSCTAKELNYINYFARITAFQKKKFFLLLYFLLFILKNKMEMNMQIKTKQNRTKKKRKKV